ncbi:MAG: CobD/CbiB family cobalamin biosynthesis protein [Acidimicrobiales bacterium]
MVSSRLAAVATGALADRLLGEMSSTAHPVALFGRLMERAEGAVWGDGRLRGAALAVPGIAVAACAGELGSRAGGDAVATAASTYLSSAGRALWDLAGAVGDLLELGDVEAARGLLPGLVGRDLDGVGAAGLARAAVESVAENTVDALMAPLMWASLAGAAGGLGYRAANTLDSMFGHRSRRYERFGWASARIDDAANLAPARVTAGLVALARPRRWRQVARAVVHDAPAHPSPNAGVAEAAFAGALGLTLGGDDTYGSAARSRPLLGSGPPACAADVRRAIGISSDVAWLAVAMLAVASVAARGRRGFPGGDGA